MKKALVVYSGGLDSILAVKILEKQELSVTALSYSSYFFDTKEAERTARLMEIPLIKKDISKRQLAVVKKPTCGYGKALNPCIDCHGLMFRVAKEVAEEEGFDLIATGEVLGQRPFSQNRNALQRVEKVAGLEKQILRPLSARLLPETIYEKKGIVQREGLLDISGRSRQRQLQLAKEFGVEYFPSPAGGCRLTEEEFGKKAKKLLDNDPLPQKNDFQLLRIGRHYWLDLKGEDLNSEKEYAIHLVLGRNFLENEELKKLARANDVLLELKEIVGPTALLVNKKNFSLEELRLVLEQTKKLVLDRTKVAGRYSPEEVDWIYLSENI